jgi:hypothetical protein
MSFMMASSSQKWNRSSPQTMITEWERIIS